MSAPLGNAAARAEFEAALDGGKLHHAWLLAGPEGVGKGSYARWIGARLVGGGARRDELIAARAHPDFKVIAREVWDKANPPRIVPYDQRGDGDAPARSIRLAQVQALLPMLATRPSLGERRVIIFDAIDDLERPGASNALLKSLEEPPAGTIFLLVSHAPGRLLPTIRSRCRLLRFHALDDAETAAVLRDVLPDAPDREIAALVAAGAGSPGRALTLAGLGLAALDGDLAALARDGDTDHALRQRLARELGVKAAQERYEAFLDRVPAVIAARARERSGRALALALDAYAEAGEIARMARANSLEAGATVYELAGLVASLA